MTDPSDWRDVLEVAIVEQLAQLEQVSPGFLAQVTESYVRTGKENVDALLEAARAGDDETMKRRAHALLGSSRQVGAKDLGLLCQEIEQSEGVAAVSAQLEQIAIEFRRAKAALIQVAERGV